MQPASNLDQLGVQSHRSMHTPHQLLMLWYRFGTSHKGGCWALTVRLRFQEPAGESPRLTRLSGRRVIVPLDGFGQDGGSLADSAAHVGEGGD
jgi:hypothetical protein